MAGLPPTVKPVGSFRQMETGVPFGAHLRVPSAAATRSFHEGPPLQAQPTQVRALSMKPKSMALKDSQWMSSRAPSVLPPPTVGSWEHAVSSGGGVAEAQEGGSSVRTAGPHASSLLHLPSGEVGGFCGMGASPQAPVKEVIPGNLHALIPSKFKYRFPRERIPRHKSYEVLAVEDNPYAPPAAALAPPPPKKPHKKKSIFGIPRRNQSTSALHRQRWNSVGPHAFGSEAALEAEKAAEASEAAQKGWVCDFKCFLCTSPDFVSEEQATLEKENLQLDEALAEFQDATRLQAIQLLETKKTYEDKLKENTRAREETARDIAATRSALEQIQAERDQLLELQRQTEESLLLIRDRIGNGLNTIFQSQTKRSDELVEKMKTFCLGVTDLLNKALPADKAAEGEPLATELLAPLTPPGTPKLSSKKPLKKKKKGKKKVATKKTKKAATGAPKKKKTRRTTKHKNIPPALPFATTGEQGALSHQTPPLPPSKQPAAATATAAGGTGKLQFVVYPGMQNPRVPPSQPGSEAARFLLEQRLAAVASSPSRLPRAATASFSGSRPADPSTSTRRSNSSTAGTIIRSTSSSNFSKPNVAQEASSNGFLLAREKSPVAGGHPVQQAAGSISKIGAAPGAAPSSSHLPPLPSSPASSGATQKAENATKVRALMAPPRQEGAVLRASSERRDESASPSSAEELSAAEAVGRGPFPLRSVVFQKVEDDEEGAPSKQFLSKKMQSLGRLWSFKSPPPLPPGLLAKMKSRQT